MSEVLQAECVEQRVQFVREATPAKPDQDCRQSMTLDSVADEIYVALVSCNPSLRLGGLEVRFFGKQIQRVASR